MIATQTRRLVLMAVIAFVAGIAGIFVGQILFSPHARATGDFHQFVHNGLDLDSSQKARLEQLEQRFATRKRALELELRSDNARLAEAIQVEHGNGPQVAAAVDRSHVVMGELQKETLAHIFAMRQLLRPDQAGRFDAAVVRALTEENR